MIIPNGGPLQSLDEIVLFPFDDGSIPLQTGRLLRLLARRRLRHGYGRQPAGAHVMKRPGDIGRPFFQRMAENP